MRENGKKYLVYKIPSVNMRTDISLTFLAYLIATPSSYVLPAAVHMHDQNNNPGGRFSCAQAAHDAEILCLAFSPVLVPIPANVPQPAATAAAGDGPADARAATRTDPANAGSTNEHVVDNHAKCAEKTARQQPGDGGGGAASPVAKTPAVAAATVGGESAAVPAQRWRAIDPADPGVKEKPARAERGGAGNGGDDLGSDKSICGADRGYGEGNPALVLLASASRDRLVHVFDASANPAARGRDGTVKRKVAEGIGSGGLHRSAARASCYPLLKTLDNHSSSVTAVKFSRDGKRCELS